VFQHLANFRKIEVWGRVLDLELYLSIMYIELFYFLGLASSHLKAQVFNPLNYYLSGNVLTGNYNFLREQGNDNIFNKCKPGKTPE